MPIHICVRKHKLTCKYTVMSAYKQFTVYAHKKQKILCAFYATLLFIMGRGRGTMTLQGCGTLRFYTPLTPYGW